MQRRHGGFVHVVDGIDQKQIWLRRGNELHKAFYLDSAEGKYTLLDVQQALTESLIVKEGKRSIRFAMPDEGFYNAYYTEQSVNNNILNVTTAKAEILKHNCRNGHKYDRGLVSPQNWDDAPLDIIRLRQPEEGFYTRLRSGTNVQFKILHQGKPVVGADVKLETKRGWIKSQQSNDQGIASFQVIQDNFFDPEKTKAKAEARKTAMLFTPFNGI